MIIAMINFKKQELPLRKRELFNMIKEARI